jgi:FKBP-type peptidyl-prolyl cis-trans isomerase 2
MSREIGRSDRVRIVALTGAAADHLIVVTAQRVPRVGDVGVVVDVAHRLGGTGRHYTVELVDAELRPVWLAVFAAHELELID